MSTDTIQRTHTAIALKGGMFTLTTLQIFTTDLEDIASQLLEKIKQAPHFFHYAPIIVDIGPLTQQSLFIDFQALVYLLKSQKLIPVGVRGATNQATRELAIQAGLALFPEEKSAKKPNVAPRPTITSSDLPSPPQAEAVSDTPTQLITQPVRSGQQIYVPGGDLIVLAAVSHGAEVLADGHIHIHGPLRGRALAGVMGNTNAMIFCKSLEAELVSIAGQYRVSEDLKETCWKQTVCIRLKQERLKIHAV